MATKTIVILGATGGQGGSVVNTFVDLKGWKVRGVTRDPTSAKAQKLAARGVEVVRGEANDKDSLIAAFQGATAIYAVTDFWVPFLTELSAAEAEELETKQGRNIVDAAAAIPTLEHLVWSTLPSAATTSGGKLSVPHFEGKVQVDKYIETSPLKGKTTFFWVGFYLGNLHWGPLQFTKLIQAGKTTYGTVLPVSPNTPLEGLVDHSTTIGPVVAAIVAQPEKSLGKYVWASNGDSYTLSEIFKLLAEAAGLKDLKYIQVTDEAFESLHGKLGTELGLMFKLWEQYGWSNGGKEVVYPADLGVTGVKSTKEYIAENDWSVYL